MTDRDVERRLRAWYGEAVAEDEVAPASLRASVTAIPDSIPRPLRPIGRRGGFTLLAAAAILVAGGVLAGGAGLLRFTAVLPAPSNAAPTSVMPSETPSATPTPAVGRPGDLIAFIRPVQKDAPCIFDRASCPIPRLWIVGSDGRDARELYPDGKGRQRIFGWSPDGSRLLYQDDGKVFLTDPGGHGPVAIDTGCAAAAASPSNCQDDSDLAFSPDGTRIVFLRHSFNDAATRDLWVISTMDLATGQVARLDSTSPAGGLAPGWSPDGRQIVFSRYGTKDTGGPVAPIKNALFVVDANGENLRQITPPTLDAFDGTWSPDGQFILFMSPPSRAPGDDADIYTIRPDGTGMRRLTTQPVATSATWTIDGRILFTVHSGAAGATKGWWTMNADGSNPALFLAASTMQLSDAELAASHPVLQPLGGAAIVPPPWTPQPAIAIGPGAPTPTPTPRPDLAPGFSLTGAPTTSEDGPLGETSTLLGDGRVLVMEGCGKAAELYDPTTGTFTPTGSLTANRGGKAATLLSDGRVLVTGGYNCARAGQDGLWASAEIYDPATGTFSATGSMKTAREFHTATLLADGRVLVAGGVTGERPVTSSAILASVQLADSSASVLATAEIYDPSTGTFSVTGSMSTFRDHHTATLLKDGRVLVAGGGGEGYASSTSADVYDPATGKFTKTGSMKTGRWLHTATLLPDGRVLVVGGRSPKDSVYRSAETYDPQSGTFTATGLLVEGRQQHTATLLTDGRVLVTAGYWSDGQHWRVLSSAEMYDPATGKFAKIGSIGTPREGHTATLLHDGRVLIVGGEDIGQDGSVAVASAMLYQP